MKIVKKLFGIKSSKASTPNTNSKKNNPLTAADVVAIALGQKELDFQSDKINRFVEELEYGETLITLITTPNKYSKLALQNIAQKLDSKALKLDQIIGDLPKIGDQLAVTSYCEDKTISEQLLEEITNEATLISLIKETHSTQLRQKLIEKVHSAEHLKHLEKNFKSKDKNSYKLIKHKLDTLKKAEQIEQAQKQKLEQFLSDLEAHSKRAFNKDYSFKYESLKRKYQGLLGESDQTLDPSLKIQADEWLTTCETTISTAVAAQQAMESAKIEQAASEQKERAQTLARKEKAIEEIDAPEALSSEVLDELLAELSLFLTPVMLDDVAIQSFSEKLQHIKSQTTTLSPKNQQACVKLIEAGESLIYALQNDGSIKHAFATLFNSAATLNDSQTAIDQTEQFCRTFYASGPYKKAYLETALSQHISDKRGALKEAEKQDKEENRHLTGLIRKAQAAVRDGHLKRAQGIRFSISEKLENKVHTPGFIQRQWDELQHSIDNLGDWQSYAIAPKLEAMVNEMKKLAEQPERPELQATKIKKLQSQWKEYTKGSADRHQTQWDQFKTYSDTAYEVCKEHYDKLDAERLENTEKREALIQQLNDYYSAYDWASTDLRQVEKVVSSAKKEWQSYSPSLRAKQKQQQHAFNKALEPIQGKLDEEYLKNKTEKERLINSLAPLTTSKDLDHAIEVAIQFQKQWKNIGRCRRKDDDALWEQFRHHCDAIFSQRDAIRDKARAETDEKINAANTVLNAISEIIDLEKEDFEKRFRDIDALKDQFPEFDTLPKSKAIALDKKLRALTEQAEKRLHTMQAQKKKDIWDKAFDIKAACMNTDANTIEHEALETQIKQQPAHIQKALQQGLAQKSIQKENVQNQYRELCIHAEILNNVESPVEDKNHRMTLQVKQLQSGFGQQAMTHNDLAEKWLSAPSAPLQDYTALFERFSNNCKPC